MPKVWMEEDDDPSSGYYECTECGVDVEKCGCYKQFKVNAPKESKKLDIDDAVKIINKHFNKEVITRGPKNGTD